MSGGSYNYLFVRELCTDTEDIERMAARLRELGHADAAEHTNQVVVSMNRARELQAQLAGVWQAVEWFDSCDWGPDDVTDAVTKWRASKR